MANDDDFTAVPSHAWWDLRERQATLTIALIVVAALVALLTLTLVSRGVVSWSDFLPLTPPHA